MGFGKLFIGYIIAFILKLGFGDYAFLAALIGFFIMYMGLSSLQKFGPAFIYAKIISVVVILLCFVQTVVFFDELFMLGLNMQSEGLASVLQWASFILDLVFNVAMLYGIIDISHRVDLPKVRTKAYRNFIFLGLFNAFQLFLMLPVAIASEYTSFVMSLLLILTLFYTIFNCALIFNCYMFICPAGDEDMPRKDSKFAFINKLNKKTDEKQEKADREAVEYYSNKRKERTERLNQKHQTYQNSKAHKKSKKKKKKK